MQAVQATPVWPHAAVVVPVWQAPVESQHPLQLRGPQEGPASVGPPSVPPVQTPALQVPPLAQGRHRAPWTPHLVFVSLGTVRQPLAVQQPVQLEGPHPPSGVAAHEPLWQLSPEGQVAQAWPPEPHLVFDSLATGMHTPELQQPVQLVGPHTPASPTERHTPPVQEKPVRQVVQGPPSAPQCKLLLVVSQVVPWKHTAQPAPPWHWPSALQDWPLPQVTQAPPPEPQAAGTPPPWQTPVWSQQPWGQVAEEQVPPSRGPATQTPWLQT